MAQASQALFLGLAAVLSCDVAQCQTAKPRVAIKTFENPANYQNSTIGNALTEILTTELAKTGKYTLIERQAADELLKELDFGTSAAVKSSTVAQKGNLAGVEYFLFGKVTNFSYKEEMRQAVVVESGERRLVTVYLQQAEVRVDFRLASTKTSEIRLSESGTAQNTNTSRRSEMSTWLECLSSGSFTSEMFSSLIGRTSVEAINNVARKLSDLAGEIAGYAAADAAAEAAQRLSKVEARILAMISATDFVISAGSRSGLKKSDRMTVYTETVIRDKQGREAYRVPKEVAMAEVIDTEASGERAIVRLLGTPAAPPQEGYVVRPAPAAGPPAPAAAGTPTPAAVPGAALDAIIRKGDRYFEDGYFAQALEQYQKANESRPRDAALLDKLASAHLYLGNLLEAETISEQMLELGMDVSLPVAHQHFSDCEGELRLRKGKVTFASVSSGHGFVAARSDLIEMKLAGEDLWFEFRVRGEDGKEKKFQLLPLNFASRVKGAFHTKEHGVRESRIPDHRKFLNLIKRLIERYL